VLSGDILLGSVGCYLTLTFTAAALAKLRTWRGSALSVIRERVLPARLAVPTVVTVALTELTLSTLVMLGEARAATGFAIVGLFACFGGYRLAR
jgi:hypothetical protein